MSTDCLPPIVNRFGTVRNKEKKDKSNDVNQRIQPSAGVAVKGGPRIKGQEEEYGGIVEVVCVCFEEK